MAKKLMTQWAGLGLPSRRDLSGQLRALAPVLVIATLLSVAVFIFVSRLHFQNRVSAYLLMDDPAPFAGLPSYTGAMSYAGIYLWCAAATVCGFGAAILWRVRQARELARFLLILAGFTVWLALDDLFVLHEQLGEAMLGWDGRHVGEALVFLVYVAIMATVVVRFRALILRTDFLLLLVAGGSFALSMVIDIILQLDFGGGNVFLEIVVSRPWGGAAADITEATLKFNGILLFFAYLTRVSYRGVQDAIRLNQAESIEHQMSRPPAPKKRRSKRR